MQLPQASVVFPLATILRRLLGKPNQTIQTGDALDPQLEFDGLTVWLWDGRGVAPIRSTTAKYCFSPAVCPSISATALQTELGPPIGRDKVDEGRNDFAVDTETCWLEATVAEDVVNSLEIECQP